MALLRLNTIFRRLQRCRIQIENYIFTRFESTEGGVNHTSK